MNPVQMIQDGTGAISSMRTVFIGLLLYIVAMNLSFNVQAIITHSPQIPLPLNDIIALIGVAMAKVGQSFSENKVVK
jgi:hypothetical protein